MQVISVNNVNHSNFISHDYNVYCKSRMSNVPSKLRFDTGDSFSCVKGNYNPSFTAYNNLLKINPYDALQVSSSAKTLEDYIRSGMFIHMPKINGQKFGDVFWEEFLKLRSKFEKSSDTDKIYSDLRKVAESLSSVEELDKAAQKQVSERASVLGSVVKQLLTGRDIKLGKDSVYLDIGCGNGEVAKSIAQNFGIADNKVKGLEIIERDDFCNIKRFKFDGQNIPKLFGKSDFVTIFNVLHHTKNDTEATNLLKSTYENMSDGGILLIRDHNAETANDIKYWQIRHLLPIRVSKVDPPCLTQDTVYHSASEWMNTLRNIGFKPVFIKNDAGNGSIYSFYLAVEK